MPQATIQPKFTDINSQDMQDFEKEIAYFYGAEDITPIAEAYLKALNFLETQESNHVLQHLTQAYAEISRQTGRNFDGLKAAEFEYQLIQAQAEQQDFDTIKAIMINLYQAVFNTESIHIHKAAMLRTFLYQYKVDLIKKQAALTPNDKNIMLAIAQESEACLSLI